MKPEVHAFLQHQQQRQGQQSSGSTFRANAFDPNTESTSSKSPPMTRMVTSQQLLVPSTFESQTFHLAYDPFSESGAEEEIVEEDEWTFPELPDELAYEKYPKVGPGISGEIGSVNLLAQPSFELKPMIEEAVMPASGVIKSTFSCYLGKVTTYIVAWTDCISPRTLRGYRRVMKNGSDCTITVYRKHIWIKPICFYRLVGLLHCVVHSTMLILRSAMIKPITNTPFLNKAATSSSGPLETSGSIRIATAGLFTDFDIWRKSNNGARANIQSVIGDHFSWNRLHHCAIEEKKHLHKARCLHAIKEAIKFAGKISEAAANIKAGASIHIWISFAEFVIWNRSNSEATFVFNEMIVGDLKDLLLCSLIRDSCVPVFVGFCAASDFHHGGEMQMERSVDKFSFLLARAGVAVSLNNQVWSERANFTEAGYKSKNPTSP